MSSGKGSPPLDDHTATVPPNEQSRRPRRGERRAAAKTPYPRCQRAAGADRPRRIRAASEAGARLEQYENIRSNLSTPFRGSFGEIAFKMIAPVTQDIFLARGAAEHAESTEFRTNPASCAPRSRIHLRVPNALASRPNGQTDIPAGAEQRGVSSLRGRSVCVAPAPVAGGRSTWRSRPAFALRAELPTDARFHRLRRRAIRRISRANMRIDDADGLRLRRERQTPRLPAK